VGFDLKDTPFGKLPGESSIYKFGYDHFTLETIYDGYICQGPISRYVGVTPIKDFINEQNLEEARRRSPNPYFRNVTVDDFNNGIARDAGIPVRFSALR
jgi:hypothetical protein